MGLMLRYNRTRPTVLLKHTVTTKSCPQYEHVEE
jgi:hypothetical protein